MLGTLLGLGTAALRERRAALDRVFSDVGATPMLAGPTARHWRCDPIPFLLTETEFSGLATALAARADAIEALLADIYGPRRLLDAGVLPPELVYRSPWYVRACRDAAIPRHLSLYAADLVRGPDGAWAVLADRTCEPAGLAYVLENRRAMARVLPELFRDFDVAEIRPFFDAWADRLREAAGAGPEAPGLALLSAGHGDPRWFEHVMLARTLGLALVEDGDLTVRDGALFLKTLRGLQPIAMLLRRVDGRHVDPLELREDAAAQHHGVPGLLFAIRNGSVAVLNAPGAGFAEAPGLAPFLPQAAAALGLAPLALPCVPTLWMGNESARAEVAEDPGRYLLRDAWDSDIPGRAFREADLEADPGRFVAVARPTPGAAPCVGEGETLEPGGLVLRLYLTRDRAGWRPLPGGLARVLGPGESAIGARPLQALSKDVWVLREDGDIVGGGGNLAFPALPIRRMAGDLPSRVADNFYWFGRYLERLDAAARLCRALLARLARAAPLPHEVPEIAVLAACLGERGVLNPEHATAAGRAILLDLLHGACTAEAGALARLSVQVQDLAGRLRDRLSLEMYDSLQHGFSGLKGARLVLARSRRAEAGLLNDLCSRALGLSATISGYAAENMVRGGGRLFLDLGRRIERAQAIATQIGHALDLPPERIEAGLALSLELCDSSITYRSRYLNVVQPAPALDLVLADDGNPRGLGYQLAQARSLLGVLGGRDDTELALVLDPLMTEARLIVADLLAAPDQAAAASAMTPRLRAMESGLSALSDAVTRRYFTLLPMRATRDLAEVA